MYFILVVFFFFFDVQQCCRLDVLFILVLYSCFTCLSSKSLFYLLAWLSLSSGGAFHSIQFYMLWIYAAGYLVEQFRLTALLKGEIARAHQAPESLTVRLQAQFFGYYTTGPPRYSSLPVSLLFLFTLFTILFHFFCSF